jgi:dUTP pyrophosphatase
VSEIMIMRVYGSDLLKYFRLCEEAKEPVYATEQSSCFDLFACLHQPVFCYSDWNVKTLIVPKPEDEFQKRWIAIPPKHRVAVPTGLIMDIPEGFSVRLYIRSGLALKFGLSLANGEGVIDSDYVEPIYVILRNDSSVHAEIHEGDRICQGELRQDTKTDFYECQERPIKKTDRDGGLGSTGA